MKAESPMQSGPRLVTSRSFRHVPLGRSPRSDNILQPMDALQELHHAQNSAYTPRRNPRALTSSRLTFRPHPARSGSTSGHLSIENQKAEHANVVRTNLALVLQLAVTLDPSTYVFNLLMWIEGNTASIQAVPHFTRPSHIKLLRFRYINVRLPQCQEAYPCSRVSSSISGPMGKAVYTQQYRSPSSVRKSCGCHSLSDSPLLLSVGTEHFADASSASSTISSADPSSSISFLMTGLTRSSASFSS